MNGKITTFLNSNLLEKYLIGQTTTDETKTVEMHIAKYPEVEEAYNTLQNNLEIFAKYNAIEAPQDGINAVFNKLDESPVIDLKPKRNSKSWHKFTVAASIAALVFAGLSYSFYNQNQKLSRENQVVVDEIFDLRNDIEKNNTMLNSVMRQLLKLNNPDTEKYLLKGNERAKNLKTVAYINPKEKTSMIDVVSLPILPEEQCYQIWVEVQDKMVNLGIISETDRQLRQIPYTENALGLHITIENKGENNIAFKENAVAEISLQTGN